MHLRSISAKTALALAMIAVLCFGVAAWLIQAKAAQEQRATANRELAALASQEAAKVKGTLEKSLDIIRGIAVAAETDIALGRADRAHGVELIRRAAEADPAVLGAWFEFEPGGFDGRDAELVAETGMGDDTLGTTDSGRYSVYWVREDGALALEASAGPDNDTDLNGEDYYVAARDAGVPMMFEPYLYEVFGDEVLMTSLMVPVRRDGQHVGVAGADLTLDAIQQQLGGIRPYGSGVLRLLSPQGMLMAGPETAGLGNAWDDPRLAEVLASTREGATFTATATDAAFAGDALQLFVPFTIGEAPERFVLMVSVPLDGVMAGVAEVRNRVMLVGVFSVLVLVVATLLILRRLVGRPLEGVVRAVDEVAAGHLDYPIAARGDDEVGRVSNALRTMQRDLKARIEGERRIAAENLRVRIALDNAGTAMLISDAAGVVAYANPAMRALLARREATLSAALGALPLDALAGLPVARLQPPGAPDPGTIREVVQAELALGDVVIAQTLAPVVDAEGQRLGTVMEWRDRTEEVAVEGEVATVIDAAGAGDLTQRIPTAGKAGFFLGLAGGINAMLDTNAGSIAEVQRVLSALAEGDLTQRITRDFQGVFGRMRDDANATAEQLADIMGRIRETVEQINTAAGEIAAGNNDLSVRTEQQAANLEETAASMEELTSTVKQNADSARQGRQLAGGAAEVAVRGGDVVKQVVGKFDGITAASRRIADIIGVIDGIAFQTNILALNAAVEAARAGEQGRGFAVVAAEVRALAQRSASAAKEIKDLIGESVTRIDEGAALVNDAGSTMEEIVTAVRRVNDLMAEISAASEEQANGIGQVSLTVTQMDGVTQQNAALVEEATAAARSLEDQAGELAGIVATFRLRPAG